MEVLCDLVSKIGGWIKPEPFKVRQVLFLVVLFGVLVALTAVVSFYGGWRSFEHSEKEKLMVREGLAAEARAEKDDEEKKLALDKAEQDKKIASDRAEQDKKFAQERQNFEMKTAQDREEERKQWPQKQKELIDQAFAPRVSQ